VIAECHALLVPYRRPYSPDAHLLFEEEAALDDEYLLDNRNHNGVALFSDGGQRIDLLANSNPFDFCPLVSQQFVDQLLSLMGDPGDLNAAGFHDLFRDSDFFGEKRKNALGGSFGPVVFVAID
jgi:hypothetical protein